MNDFKLGDTEYTVKPGGVFKLAFLLLLIGVTVWLFGFSPGHEKYTVDATKAWLAGLGGWGWAVYVGGLALLIALCVPVNPIIFIGAVLFGFWGGTGLTFVASVLGCMVAYGLSRWVLGDIMRALFKDKLDAFVQKLNTGFEFKPFGLFTIRLNTVRSLAFLRGFPIAVIPGWIVNYGCGMARIRFRTYMLTSLWMIVQSAGYMGMFILLGVKVPGSVSLGWLFLIDFLLAPVAALAITIIVCIVRWLRGKKQGEQP